MPRLVDEADFEGPFPAHVADLDVHPWVLDAEIVGLVVCAGTRRRTLDVGGSQRGRLDLEDGLVQGIALLRAAPGVMIGRVGTVEKRGWGYEGFTGGRWWARK